MAAERVIIVGGVAAGTSAAAKAKRTNPNLDIVLYQREAFVSYSACGLPYYIGGWVTDHNKLIARTPQQFGKDGIAVKIEHDVLDIDADAGRITVRDKNGSMFHDHYDHLILATGARVDCPNVPGIDLGGVFRLRSMQDGLAIKQFIVERKPQSAVIVGAGYIGIEMAEALLELGIATTLINRSKQVLSGMDADVTTLIEQTIVASGVNLVLNAQFEALHGTSDDDVMGVVAGGQIYPAELVIIATGVTPNSELAAACGITLGERNAILVDGVGRTSKERIYAAGDCATVMHRTLQRPVYIPLGTTANKQGRTLGAFLAGIERPFAGVVGSSVTKYHDLHIASTGLSEQQATGYGYTPRTVLIESTDHAGYYPNARPIHVKLVGDATTGALLGGQIVGYDDVAKRVDVLAVALAAGMSVDDLAWSDLTYAPPFSSVWDPILVAAQALAKQR